MRSSQLISSSYFIPRHRRYFDAASTTTGPFVSQTPGVDPAALLPADWWRLYDDPALDTTIEAALAANTDLRAANSNLLRARAVLSEARAGRYPLTTTSGGTSWGRGMTSQGGAYNSDTGREGWSGQGGITAAWEVDLFGRVGRLIEAARDDADAIVAARTRFGSRWSQRRRALIRTPARSGIRSRSPARR